MMAPVTQYMVEQFGWRGCVLILAGVTLNCAVFGSLFRPVEHLRHSQSQKPLLLRIKEARDALWTESDDEVNEVSPTASQNSAPPPYSEIVNIVNDSSGKRFLSPEKYEVRKQSLQVPNDVHRYRRRTKSYDESRPYFREEMVYSAMSLIVLRSRSATGMSQTLDKSTKLSSIKSMNESKEKSSQQISESKATISSMETRVCFPSNTLTEMFDLNLLKSPSFLLLSLSGFLCLVGFFIPFMYIADRAKLLGKASNQFKTNTIIYKYIDF